MKSLFFSSYKLSTFSFLFLFTWIQLFSQQPNSVPKTQETKKIPLFYEKVYLHTDKNYYSSGEDIWFKAYLVNAISNIPMQETSKNLYVDLISWDQKRIEQKLILLKSGYGIGDFKLSDSIPGGTYKLRAYTNWMRNFGSIFLFEKEIKIYNTININPSQHKKTSQEPSIQFFPESGSLISEALNNVAFKATDQYGNGCEASGAIINNTSDTIGYFHTTHLGMGVFAYMPIYGQKYYAVGTIKNIKPFKIELPEPLSTGYGIQVTDFDTSSFFVSIITNQQTLKEKPNNVLILNGLSHAKNCFTTQFLVTETKTDIRIPKRNFRAGITNLTLYDTLLIPQCQRLFYISKNNNIKINVNTDKQVYQTREKVNLNIKVTNLQDVPLKAILSMAITDKEEVPDTKSNIASYLNLESEIKGKIENPTVYFDISNKLRYRQLDLLLLTQGWRDFLWRRIKDTSIIIKYMVEPGLTLSGKVRQKLVDKPIPNATVTLFAMSGINGKIFSTKTQDDGKYYFDGIEFFGTQNIIISASNEKGKNKGWVFLNKPEEVSYPNLPFENLTDSFLVTSKFTENAAIRKNSKKKYSISDTIRLDEVLVTAKNAREEKQDKEIFINGGQVDYSYTIKPEDESMDIGTYMATRIPRVQISMDPVEGVDGPVPYNRVMVRNAGKLEPPSFILDGFPLRKGDLSDENVIYNLSVADIERIVVSTNDIKNGGIGSYIIGVFTKPNAGSKSVFYSLNQKYPGYYEARTFYSPVYPEANPSIKPDLRPTLYWNPEINTNENGECSLNFFTSDKTSRFRIILEGITDQGIPVVNTSEIEVKK